MTEEIESDLRLAWGYLDGYVEFDENKIPRQRYHPENSTEALRGRAALSRILLADEPLDRQIRHSLGRMFDPFHGTRKLEIKFREKNRLRDAVANTHMATFIWERVKGGENVEAAIQAAMEEFSKSREHMYDLWIRYKRLFEKIEGILPLRSEKATSP
jgi:hypothetical protein